MAHHDEPKDLTPGQPPDPPRPPKRQVAVALRYDPKTDYDVPTVVASGQGHVAERILEIAFAQGIKVREDADLAEILAAVDVDSVIPLEAFMAVAEILAYVYKASNKPLPETTSDP